MHVSMYEVDGKRHLFVRDGDRQATLGAIEVLDLIEQGEHGSQRLRDALDGDQVAPPAGAHPRAPLLRPSKIISCGVNYGEHVAELPPPWKATEHPFFFLKMPSSIIGAEDDIVIPSQPSAVDYEVEMSVVIGTTGRNIPIERALDHVFGYTIVNDLTERNIQATDNQLTMSKGIDTFCPMGPAIVTADEITDPDRLAVQTTVNGEVRQQSNTSDLIFGIPRLIAELSAYFTLVPGDIITTGSPSGCGGFLDPPVYLQPGDRVTVSVEGIGELSNPLVA